MIGILHILACWLIGNALSQLTGNYISGNIIGMVLLFISLSLGWVRPERVRPAARFLLGAMALFFIPYGVGLVESYRVILDNLAAIVTASAVSTVLVLLVCGWTYQSLSKNRK